MAGPHTVVFGGSRGIGRVVVRAFADAGHQVSVLSRNPSDDPADERPEIRHVAVDLLDAESLERALDAVAEGDPVSNLVFFQRYRGSGGDDWTGEIEVSLTATKRTIERLFSGRPEASETSVVLISSLTASRVAEEQPLSYHVANAALDQMTRYYAVKLGPEGVRVNAVAPGVVLKEEAKEFYRENGHLSDAFARATPLGRMTSSADIAGAVMFLCSPQASFVTGQTIAVDGGLSLLFQGSLARKVPAEASAGAG